MSVETTAKFITEFNEGYPRKNDLLKEGDDHLRLIKAVLKNTLPGFNRTINIKAEKLNRIDALMDPTDNTLRVAGNFEITEKNTVSMGGNIVSGVAAPAEDTDAVNLKYLKEAGVGFAWPVGSVYMSMDVRNPSEIFGFGTWEAFATGRVIIGVGSSKDANQEAKLIALSATGGNYNEKLTVDQMAVHKHGGKGYKVEVDEGGEHRHAMKTTSSRMSIDDTRGDWFRDTNNRTMYTENGGKHTHTGKVTGDSDDAGKGAAHNNMMPYIGVNIWKRTK